MTDKNPLEIVTPRQAELMRYLVTGMSNQEIAKAMYISESTVKSLINGVFERARPIRKTRTALAVWWMNCEHVLLYGTAKAAYEAGQSSMLDSSTPVLQSFEDWIKELHNGSQ